MISFLPRTDNEERKKGFSDLLPALAGRLESAVISVNVQM